jgi:pyrophosphatase PpaX
VDPDVVDHRGLKVVTVWICDVNGVLVDSTAVARDAFAAAAAHWRFRFIDRDYRSIRSLTLLEAYARLDPGGDAGARRRFHLRHIRERIGEIRACPHVVDMLTMAKAQGVRVGAVTSYGETAEACLVSTGLYSYIDCLVTQEEVKRPKPHPDLLLRAMALFEIEPHRPESDWAVHIGDSPLDIEAGKAAGVRTIGVTYGVAEESEIRAATPDHLIHSFAGMQVFLRPPEGSLVSVAAGYEPDQ